MCRECQRVDSRVRFRRREKPNSPATIQYQCISLGIFGTTTRNSCTAVAAESTRTIVTSGSLTQNSHIATPEEGRRAPNQGERVVKSRRGCPTPVLDGWRCKSASYRRQ